jgi:hypothetical protein
MVIVVFLRSINIALERHFFTALLFPLKNLIEASRCLETRRMFFKRGAPRKQYIKFRHTSMKLLNVGLCEPQKWWCGFPDLNGSPRSESTVLGNQRQSNKHNGPITGLEARS